MARTKIEWCDRVWNPISGCTKVSAGCTHCYASRMSKRLAGRYGYPADDPFRVTLHPDKLMEPLSWKEPQRVFLCSMSDWMHNDVPTRYIDQMLEVMGACPQHIFLTLTKRPENLEEKLYGSTREHGLRYLGGGDYLPNLWIGVSVEDQKTWDERVPILCEITAAKLFVSVEPYLSEIGTTPYLDMLSLVICGCETGPKARPMDIEWARSLRDQCKSAGVAFFMKRVSHGEIPDDLMIREFPNE